MQLKKTVTKNNLAIKIIAKDDAQIIGRAYLYLISNDLHKRPYGLLEDVFVREDKREQGIGAQLVTAVITEAKKRGCYKLIATSRRRRARLHNWYKKFGFKDWGKEFRINF